MEPRLDPNVTVATIRIADRHDVDGTQTADAYERLSVLLEIHDEWAIAARRYLSEGSMASLDQGRDDGSIKEVERAKTVLLAS